MGRFAWQGVLVLLLLMAAGWGALRPPTRLVALGERLGNAELGPLLATHDPLASFEAGPFLGNGWAPIGPPLNPRDAIRDPLSCVEGVRRTLGRKAELRFYLTQLIPLHLVLAGTAPGPQTVRLRLNGQNPRVLQVDGQHPDASFDAEVGELKEGLNRLELDCDRTTYWKDFRVQARNQGQGFQPEVVLNPEFSPADWQLRLPFAQALELPLEVSPRSWLVLDGLQPWTQPGAPSLADPWELLVRVRSSSPPLDRSWHFQGSGKRSIHLPVSERQEVALTVLASSKGKPGPGQAGLLITNPHLDSWSPDAGLAPARPVPAPQSGAAKRCNVLVYLIDTLRADHLRCYGYPHNTSPRIDALARDGVVFLNATAQSSWTKAATASVLTSLLPRDHKALDFADRLPESVTTLAEVLQGEGYETRAVVANPFVGKDFGFSQGFHDFQLLPRLDSFHVNQLALPWLRQQGPDKPFFLYLHTIDPHTPYDPPKRFLRRNLPGIAEMDIQKIVRDSFWARAQEKPDATIAPRLRECVELYDGEIAANDDAFGQVVQTLKRQGLYDNTMIVVLSDHGEEFLEHGGVGHITTLYQELLHVPLIVKFPANRGQGTVVQPTWQQIDVAPTILAELGIKPPDSWAGRPYVPGGPLGEATRPAFFTLVAGKDAARFGQGARPRFVSLDGVRVGPWVFNRTHCSMGTGGLQPEELYNLEADPQEYANVAYQRPEIRLELSSLLRSKRSGEGKAADKLPDQEVERILRALQYLR